MTFPEILVSDLECRLVDIDKVFVLTGIQRNVFILCKVVKLSNEFKGQSIQHHVLGVRRNENDAKIDVENDIFITRGHKAVEESEYFDPKMFTGDLFQFHSGFVILAFLPQRNSDLVNACDGKCHTPCYPASIAVAEWSTFDSVCRVQK